MKENVKILFLKALLIINILSIVMLVIFPIGEMIHSVINPGYYGYITYCLFGSIFFTGSLFFILELKWKVELDKKTRKKKK